MIQSVRNWQCKRQEKPVRLIKIVRFSLLGEEGGKTFE